MSLLILHHRPEVGLGTLAESLDARDLDLVHVEVTATNQIDVDGASGVLLLGGRPDDPFPGHELDAVRAAIDAETPVFGLGHGADVIATVLGGELAPRERPEVGLPALHRTEPGKEDDVAAGWPDGSRALALHRHEVVLLPTDADQLLIGSDGPSLWRLGTAWATPLHLEAGPDDVQRWLDHPDVRAMLSDAGVEADDLVAQARSLAAFTRAAGSSLVLRWVDGVVTA
jgi:GMP synthase-like glutamine amidotransferase